MKKLIPLLLIILVIASCSSGPKKIDETLNPVELFQLAQEASDNKDYGTAVKYYEVFISKYSDDIQHLVEAEYEIAFITYKQGNLILAKDLFTDLLGRYSGEGAQVLPAWPMVLSKKVLIEIEEKSLKF